MHKYRNQILLGIAFTFGVMIFVVLLSNARELFQKLDAFPLWLFLPIIGLKVMNWVLRYLEWHYFLHVIGVHAVIGGETRPPVEPDQPATIRVQDSFVLWMASLPFALSPGKVAEVLKALVLKSMTQTPVTHSAPIIFAERIVDGIAVVILVTMSAFAASQAIFAVDDLSVQYIRAILIGTMIFMVVIIGVVQFPKLAHGLLTSLNRLPLLGRFQNDLKTLYDSSHELAKIRHIIPTTFFGMGAYFSDCIGFYLMLLGLGQKSSLELFAQATFILGFSVVISALSAMPGGAGGRELTIGTLLKNIVGMSSGAIGAAVLMIGIFQVWFGAFIGIILGIVFRKRLFPPSLEAEIKATEHQDSVAALI